MAIRLDKSKTDGCINTYREIFSDPYKSGDESTITSGVTIPLDFSLEVDGISGIIPNSAFTIPAAHLPKSYIIQEGEDKGKQKIAFILHTLDQNFSNNKWTTKITGQTLNIRFEPMSEADKKAIEEAKKKNKLSSAPSGSNIQPGSNIQHYADSTPNYKMGKNKQDAYNKAEAAYPGFKARLRQAAANIGVSEDVMVTVMYKESGLRPNIRNSIGCVGLIQFCPDSKGSGTKKIGKNTYNLSDIQNSGVNQFDYVESYFKSQGFNSSTIRNASDLYGATFYPVSKNKPMNWVMGSEKSDSWAIKVASQNPAIAKFSNRYINGQKVIDKASFEKYIYA
jgi:hypothetical protein